MHDLNRKMTEGEHDAARRGEPLLTRHDIHELALPRDHKKMVAATKLRAAGHTPIPKPSIKDRLDDLKNAACLRLPVLKVARENADIATTAKCEAISSKIARKPYIIQTLTARTLRQSQPCPKRKQPLRCHPLLLSLMAEDPPMEAVEVKEVVEVPQEEAVVEGVV